MFLDPLLMVWLPLLASILCLFFSKERAAFCLLFITLVVAMVFGRLELMGAVSVAAGIGLAYGIRFLPEKIRFIGHGLVLLWCIALFLHLLPGFNNLKVLDQVLTGEMSIPFSMHINLDKPLALFALFIAYPCLLGKRTNLDLPKLALVSIATLALLPIAWQLGALKPEWSLPNWWWLFVLNNLLLTCVAEEALFRGYIQQGLAKRFGWVIGLGAASFLFGLAHIAGGTMLVIFASLAGVGYGLAFYFSSRLWVAVALHFLFNLCHLLFFTYPMLSASPAQ